MVFDKDFFLFMMRKGRKDAFIEAAEMLRDEARKHERCADILLMISRKLMEKAATETGKIEAMISYYGG